MGRLSIMSKIQISTSVMQKMRAAVSGIHSEIAVGGGNKTYIKKDDNDDDVSVLKKIC